MRLTRKKYSEFSEAERRKAKTRSYTRVLLTRNKLQRQPCFCGSQKAEAHHPDYGNPRLVVWLCRPHHVLKHQGII